VTAYATGLSPGAGIVVGPDGNLWFTQYLSDGIGRMTPSGTVTEFTTGITNLAEPFGLAVGADGNLWFTEYGSGGIGRITPTGAVTEFSGGLSSVSQPQGIARGPDGNMWFTENTGGRIGRITPAGAITQFSAGISPGGQPQSIAAGPDGNMWFTELGVNRIGRITPTGTVTEFSAGISPGGELAGIAAGPGGDMWFTEYGAGQIGRVTPTGTVTEFPAISPSSEPAAITAGPGDNMWFTTTGQIGSINTLTPLTRLAGVDRVATAIAVSQSTFPTAASASSVVLVRSDAFPDALTGAALAAAKNAPLLLTASDNLDARTALEMARVLGPGPKTVYLLGGDEALTPAVAATVAGLGYVVVRFAGTDRYDTAAQVASGADGLDNPTTVLLATGLNFPDGLCASSAAGRAGAAILLTVDASLPTQTAAYLGAHPSDTVFAVGGQAAAADPAAIALAGSDRYQTCVAVAAHFFGNPTAVGISTGLNFPDGLAGAAHAFAKGGPLLLSDPNGLSANVLTYLSTRARSIANIFVYGGTNALPDAISAAAQSATS